MFLKKLITLNFLVIIDLTNNFNNNRSKIDIIKRNRKALIIIYIYLYLFIFLIYFISIHINLDRWSRADFRILHLTVLPSPSNIQLTRMAFTLRVPTFLRRPLSRKPSEEHSRRIRPDPMTRSTIDSRFSRDSVDRYTTPTLTGDSNFAHHLITKSLTTHS